ncbi:MAG: DUF4276 family protein [bacterium]|nr:DUF4276 family protein [bacterium]
MDLVNKLIAPHLAEKGVYLYPTMISKKGQKGGDVRFSRVANDIEKFLKQRRDTSVTTLVDFYGIKSDWPGYEESRAATPHTEKARIMNEATHREVNRLFPESNTERRFIPYVSMYETESLLFSAPEVLAEKLNIRQQEVIEILNQCGAPEEINDSYETKPSKRLKGLSPRFKKISTGIAIAEETGIERIRAACPLFGAWLGIMEDLAN